MAAERVTLIYDGSCGLCRDTVALVRAWDRDGALDTVPFQDRARVAAFGIALPALAAAMHLVLPDGRVFAGADAAPEILARLPGKRWLAAPFRLPGARWCARRVYRWVAARRRCAVLPAPR
jgi:predicted DCC family thiol-disulfide oxidoreductase YuxK